MEGLLLNTHQSILVGRWHSPIQLCVYGDKKEGLSSGPKRGGLCAGYMTSTSPGRVITCLPLTSVVWSTICLVLWDYIVDCGEAWGQHSVPLTRLGRHASHLIWTRSRSMRMENESKVFLLTCMGSIQAAEAILSLECEDVLGTTGVWDIHQACLEHRHCCSSY